MAVGGMRKKFTEYDDGWFRCVGGRRRRGGGGGGV
jgi:hypothetical protein